MRHIVLRFLMKFGLCLFVLALSLCLKEIVYAGRTQLPGSLNVVTSGLQSCLSSRSSLASAVRPKALFGRLMQQSSWPASSASFIKGLMMPANIFLMEFGNRFCHKPPVPNELSFQMNADQMTGVLEFLEKNKTPDGMTLSYQIPEGFWESVRHPPDSIPAILERLLAENSVNIYDAACSQIAETILGRTDLADWQTRRLLSGSSGDLDTIRAHKEFIYNGKKFSKEHAWFFRIISDRYLQEDPLDGKKRFRGFLTWAELHHEDWKPIAGEQAWAAIIGPLQVAYQKYDGKVPLDAMEVRLALSILPVIEAMQSPVGGIYHAPEGTSEKSPRDISNENNISMFAALQMLSQVLEPYREQESARAHIGTVRKILYGEGVSHDGILGYFRDYTYNTAEGVFDQGGLYYSTGFKRTEDLAVDVQTWGMLVIGPELIDGWFGEGACYRIWDNVKRRAGFYDNDRILRGVGYTDSYDVTSGEWGLGAVMMLRRLTSYYQDKHSSWSEELRQDAITMRRGIEKLKMELTDGSIAYKYANRRYYITFGWWANPVPSAASTTWAVMVDANFNPFILGGGADRILQDSVT